MLPLKALWDLSVETVARENLVTLISLATVSTGIKPEYKCSHLEIKF